jgi:methionyl-tRNA formyltransferase
MRHLFARPLRCAGTYIWTKPWPSLSFRVKNICGYSSLAWRSIPDSDPLRILFCGTDKFSAIALAHLYEYAQTSSSANIKSIDVVTKSSKRTGRGLKLLTAPPIKAVAEEFGLKVHQINTFTGWEPPEYQVPGTEHEFERCNLIIAVSFGLLIPPRILGSAKYGGLNVHPSLLPDLRGPAPIEWAILNGYKTTGVSVQTLHPTKFDQGIVLGQRTVLMKKLGSAGGRDVVKGGRRDSGPLTWNVAPEQATAPGLREIIAPIGARMLVNTIKDRLYIPPYQSVVSEDTVSKTTLRHASKITTDMRATSLLDDIGERILRRNRAIGPLHSFATNEKGTHRINFSQDIRAEDSHDLPPKSGAEKARKAAEKVPKGVPYVITEPKEILGESKKALFVNTLRKPPTTMRRMVIPTITVAGGNTGPAAGAAARSKLFAPATEYGDYKLYVFHHPLSAQEIAKVEAAPTDVT